LKPFTLVGPSYITSIQPTSRFCAWHVANPTMQCFFAWLVFSYPPTDST